MSSPPAISPTSLSSSVAPAQGCCRVKVRGLSPSATEVSVREFFSFCGDIRLLHLYAALDGESIRSTAIPALDGSSDQASAEEGSPEESKTLQEAVILFEGEAGASTAVLLDNAVVDGCRIRVELFPEAVGSPKTAPAAGAKGGRRLRAHGDDSKSSLWSDIVSEGSAVASETWRSAKGVDDKYELSGRVKSAAATVASATTAAAKGIDDRLHVRESATAAWAATRDGVAAIDHKLGISSAASSWFGWRSDLSDAGKSPPAGGSPKSAASPRPASSLN